MARTSQSADSEPPMLDDELVAASATDRMVTDGGQPITAVLI